MLKLTVIMPPWNHILSVTVLGMTLPKLDRTPVNNKHKHNIIFITRSIPVLTKYNVLTIYRKSSIHGVLMFHHLIIGFYCWMLWSTICNNHILDNDKKHPIGWQFALHKIFIYKNWQTFHILAILAKVWKSNNMAKTSSWRVCYHYANQASHS